MPHSFNHYFELRYAPSDMAKNAKSTEYIRKMAEESFSLMHTCRYQQKYAVAISFPDIQYGLYASFGSVIRFYSSTPAGLAFLRECFNATFEREIHIEKIIQLTEIKGVPEDIVGWVQFIRFRVPARKARDYATYNLILEKARCYPLVSIFSRGTNRYMPIQVMPRILSKDQEAAVVFSPNTYGLANIAQFPNETEVKYFATPVFATDRLAAKFVAP